MKNIKSKQLARNIVLEIFSGKLKPNQKLASEQQITIKYEVSKIVAIKAFDILKKIGAIYSLPKKGFFVAEYFANIIRSIDEEYKTSSFEDTIKFLGTPPLNKNTDLTFKYKTFTRKHIRNKKLIMHSWNWLNEDVISYEENKDLVSKLVWSDKLISAVSILRFEKIEVFDQKVNLVLTKIYYGQNVIAFVQKVVIEPKIFYFLKNEWSI